MRTLSPCELLSVWERGREMPLPQRALALLAAGASDSEAHPASIGERDARLIELRERTFGRTLAAVVTCTSCGELLEIELDARDLRAHGSDAVKGPLEVEAGAARARFRLPDPNDLVAAAAAPDVEQGRAVLLERCLLGGRLTPELERAVAERMATADPVGWIELSLACPACAAQWSALFDIVSFLWAEVEACARALVRDVHTLASAYGWREREVLALSSARRASYLELVAG